MNWQRIAESKIIENLGWTLIDSVWQIAIIALVLYAVLAVTRKYSSNLRYLISVLALLFSLLVPAANFFIHMQNPPDSAAIERKSSLSLEQTRQEISRGSKTAPPVSANEAGSVERSRTILESVSGVSRYLPTAIPIGVMLWMFGVAFSAFRILGGVGQIHRFKTHAASEPSAEWMTRFSSVCEKLHIRRRVKFIASNIVKTPIAVGIFKPVIIVPASVFLQVSPIELETILAHELIHIRRYDPLVNIIQNAVASVLFYHPGIWWMTSVIRREREFAADAAVVAAFDDSHIVYARALANLEEIRHTANHATPSLAAAANGGNLMQRIQRILQKNTEKDLGRSAWSAGAALMLISAVVLAVFSFNSSTVVNAHGGKEQRKIAIGFVGLPPVDRSANPPADATSTAKILMEVLKSHKIPAIGFLNGAQVSDGSKIYPVRAEIVREWRDAGFEVGIGTYQHISFYDTPFDDYVSAVDKNLNIANRLVGERKQAVRFFSYPYLNTGKSSEERAKFESWLQARGVSPVKYTFDNQEWMYSYVYDVARLDNDLSLMKETRAAYLDYMAKMIEHYEAYSQQMFGRDIAQTMVLTPSRLVADTGHELFGMLEKRGYSFVSMNHAQSDPAYQTDENFVGKAGISWFERWQMKQGKQLLHEPDINPEVLKLWNAKKK